MRPPLLLLPRQRTAGALSTSLRISYKERTHPISERSHLTMLFTFKSEAIAAQWPHVWEPLRLHFCWFCERCAFELRTPPIIVTCLSRTPTENAAVGGQPKSLHLVNPCRAIDIRRRGFGEYAERMKALWQGRGPGWDFVIEGPPQNRKPPHFHIEADWRVSTG